MDTLSDSVWETPDITQGSPPGASPLKVQRTGSGHGPVLKTSDGAASGETPLTTTASTSRTVHIDGSPTYPPDVSPDRNRGAAALIALQQAQLTVAGTALALQKARDKASQKSGDGSDRGSKAGSRRAG